MNKSNVETVPLPNANFGHDGKQWPQTMDAKIWADEFCKRNSASDHGTMLAWFANAIMLGYETAQRDKEIK
jgi:hypothetical protein